VSWLLFGQLFVLLTYLTMLVQFLGRDLITWHAASKYHANHQKDTP